MKSILKFCLVALVVVTTILSSCKKYEDGPMISFRSKEHRIEGNWKITSYKYNGQEAINIAETSSDSTQTSCGTTLFYTYSDKLTSDMMNITKGNFTENTIDNLTYLDEQSTYDNCSIVMKNADETWSGSGTWKWSSDKKQIIISYGSGYGNNTAPVTYNILELKEKEMKLKGSSGGGIEEITLTQ